MGTLANHELANIFPLMEGEPFKELVDDIRANGLREPITLLDGLILDGRNRYRACRELRIEPAFTRLKGGDPLAYVISMNLRRRHLKESQRAMVAASMANMKQGGRRDLGRRLGEITETEAAQMLNVSVRSVRNAKQVNSGGTASIKEAVARGVVSVSAAAKVSHLPAEKQNALIASSGVVAEARRISKQPQKQGRSEFSAIWGYVDEIIDALNSRRLDKADMAAAGLRREIAKVTAARK